MPCRSFSLARFFCNREKHKLFTISSFFGVDEKIQQMAVDGAIPFEIENEFEMEFTHQALDAECFSARIN